MIIVSRKVMLQRIKQTSLLLFLTLFSTITFAQEEMMRVAEDHLKKGNYIAAYNIYKRYADKDSMNAEANFGAGFCVLEIPMDKRESVKYLERSMRAGIKNKDAMFFMGMAYHYNLNFEMALAAYNEYLNEEKGSLLGEVGRYIENVKNAQKVCKEPVSVLYENAGPQINSQYPDYYPMITPSESFMAFTTRRKKNVGARLEFDGFFPSDIWMSKVSGGEFKAAENMGRGVNTPYDEQLVGMSYNADKVFVYRDNVYDYGNIYFSDYSEREKEYMKAIKYDEVINSDAFESAASVSADHQTVFFSSDRKGGYGGTDIYMTRLLPNGHWAIPQNLGENINTKYNEDFPNLFYDGQTLYFASQGHNSIGGYDLFKSSWDPEANSWTKAENIGFPVNTPEDNMTISFTKDQLHAYISTYREDSYGLQDIYRITFLEKDPRRTVYRCKLKKKDTEQVIRYAYVSVIDNETEQEIGNYAPTPSTGSMILALQPGSYHISIESDGYEILETDIVVKGKSDFKDEQIQEFVLTPKR